MLESIILSSAERLRIVDLQNTFTDPSVNTE